MQIEIGINLLQLEECPCFRRQIMLQENLELEVLCQALLQNSFVRNSLFYLQILISIELFQKYLYSIFYVTDIFAFPKGS
jgi:hypothetical protein